MVDVLSFSVALSFNVQGGGCCGSVLFLVRSVRTYTLVHLLCE